MGVCACRHNDISVIRIEASASWRSSGVAQECWCDFGRSKEHMEQGLIVLLCYYIIILLLYYYYIIILLYYYIIILLYYYIIILLYYYNIII